jgi:hypothetical protein
MSKAAMLLFVLAMTLTLEVKAAPGDGLCDTDFRNEVTRLYADDTACETTLLDLLDTVTETACTDAEKTQIKTCVDNHRADWVTFDSDCQDTVNAAEDTPAPSDSSVTVSSAGPAEAPDSSTDEPETSDMEPASEGPTPDDEDSSSSPVIEPASAEGSEEAEAPAPAARRLSRRLLYIENEGSMIDEYSVDDSQEDQLGRILLQTTSDTCYELIYSSGVANIAPSDTTPDTSADEPAETPESSPEPSTPAATQNAASNIQISIFSIIGSILLGLMLL